MLSREIEEAINCVCGICDHSYGDNNCIYNKIIDSPEPSLEMKKQIEKIIKNAVLLNTTKAKCATIKAKKEVKK